MRKYVFLGIGKIRGPDWWFVLVYPLDILMKAARQTGLFLALIGLISLLIELLMLFQVLQKYVTRPIKKLISVSTKIAGGDREARVKIEAEDEIGQLGQSFNIMAEKVQERDEKLQSQATELEHEVQERTEQLDVERARAYEASKMATLGEIAGGVAHEINNPLGTITLSAGALRKRLDKGMLNREDIYPFLYKIEDTAQRISKIVRGLRAFSRNAENDEICAVPVRSLVENTLNLCEETLKKNLVRLECDEIPDINVLCREVQIIQTLLNLIQNAIDALEPVFDKQIKISFIDADNFLTIVVEDNGPGIPEDIQEKIMNPFFTTKELGKGTGLGLFISYGLIESNGGKLSFESTAGSTKFKVKLKKMV